MDLEAQLPASSGEATGTVAGDPVNIKWNIPRNNSSPTIQLVIVDGKLVGQAVSLSGTFRLLPDELFDSGTVMGTQGGRVVQAQVSRASGENTSSVNVNGSFAGTTLSFYSTIAGDLSGGLIRGTVGGKAIQLTAKVRSTAIHIAGTYSGPPSLLVVAADSLLFFVGGIYA